MTDPQKSIVLITGANSGIGFELAAQLLNDGNKHVLLGSRSVDKGDKAVKDLQSRGLPGSVELLQVDVSDESSIAAAAKAVEENHARLDALVNNAGTMDDSSKTSMFEKLNSVFRTNAAGPYAMVKAFTPLLSRSRNTPRIINVSSSAGSIASRLNPSDMFYSMMLEQYRASKSALNMITACQIVEYHEKGWKVFLYCPGFTESNLSPLARVEKGAHPTSEGARPMVDMLNGNRDAEAGRFLTIGGEHPW
ncbi:hypothetical protein FB567DRAFT_607231 [Paraphoma chrysanthemicola]|uniref:Short chain dehydrogenase n=1 Tax=Paraphoma chrysanthemicola TaxID=798071 RepID=A0A8K0R184_9PLEO|nr:hypothetical protein FB567DRAFT_607231 [Paraphoma chrysanthemicola]